MNSFSLLRIAVAALLPIVSACGDDEPADPSTATSFTATLSGANEVPLVTTTAAGTATLEVVGSSIQYTINGQNLTNAILGHIHVAQAGANGNVRLNLCGTGAPEPACTSQPGTTPGVVATGTNGVTNGITFDSLLSAMRTSGAYVNVHTNGPDCTAGVSVQGCNPGGEIRGQIVAE